MKKIIIIICLVVFSSGCATTPEQKAAWRNFAIGFALGMQNANQQQQAYQQQALQVQKRAAVGMNMPVYFPDGTVVNPPQRIYTPVYTAPSQPQVVAEQKYLGRLSSNRYQSDSTSNPYGQYGSSYSSNSINNPYGQYGSQYSSNSANNPYAANAPKLYDSQGNYRGKLSSNRYDPDSVSNPYGRYGSEYSSDSINNPYGAGSCYKSDSPNNPYGSGLKIVGDN